MNSNMLRIVATCLAFAWPVLTTAAPVDDRPGTPHAVAESLLA